MGRLRRTSPKTWVFSPRRISRSMSHPVPGAPLDWPKSDLPTWVFAFKKARILIAFASCVISLGFAQAQQPAESTFSLDARGRPLGGNAAPVQVKVTGRVLDAETG